MLHTYSCSKRANRFFTWSLNQKLKGVIAVGRHPGWTGTNLPAKASGVVAWDAPACRSWPSQTVS